MKTPRTDVLIVGGGFSGLVIGELLSAQGIHCRILEAGPALRGGRMLEAAASRHEHPDRARWESHLVGVNEGAVRLPGARTRIRALGGRSLVWGGWSERFDAHPLADAKKLGKEWPMRIEELAPYYRDVERLLTVQRQPASFRVLEKKMGWRVRGPAVARNGARVRTAVSLARARRNVVTEAIVRRVLLDGERARGVEYWDHEGRLSEARAPIVVLCASPEETVRILLTEPSAALADRAHLIGSGVVDHLMVSYIAAAPGHAFSATKKRAERGMGGTAAFVPRFVNTSRATRRDYLGGFSLELHGPVAASRLAPDWQTMLRLDERAARESTAYVVTAMGDAIPDPARRISLHPSAKDSLGRPITVVHQATSENDRRMIADMKQTALGVLDAMMPAGGVIVSYRDPMRHRALFHEAGGCCMGRDSETSVTDCVGRVRGVDGVYVADTSIFPTGGDRHPTLTLLALAARAAESIARACKVGFEPRGRQSR